MTSVQETHLEAEPVAIEFLEKTTDNMSTEHNNAIPAIIDTEAPVEQPEPEPVPKANGSQAFVVSVVTSLS